MAMSFNDLYQDFQRRRTAGTTGASPSAPQQTQTEQGQKLQELIAGFQASAEDRREKQRQRAQQAITERQSLPNLQATTNNLLRSYNSTLGGNQWRTSQELDALQRQLDQARKQYTQTATFYNSYGDLLGTGGVSTEYADMLNEMQRGLDSAREDYGRYDNADAWMQEVGYARKYAGMDVGELQRRLQELSGGFDYRDGTDQTQRLTEELEEAQKNLDSYSGLWMRDQDAQMHLIRQRDMAQANLDNYTAHLGDRNEAAWLQDYLYSGSAAYDAGATAYGVDLYRMTPYEVVQWADDPSRTQEQKAWAQEYMANAAAGSEQFGEQDYRAKAMLQHEYEQRREELTDQQRAALDEAIRARLDARSYAETTGGADLGSVMMANATLDEIEAYAALTGMSREDAEAEVKRLSGWTEYQEQLDYRRQLREQAAARDGGIYTVGTWATQPFANWEARLATWGSALSGEGLSSSDPLLQSYLNNQAVRQTRAEVWASNPALKGKTIFGQDAGSYVYNTINSMVDSWVNRQLMMGASGALGLALDSGAGKVVGALVSDAVMGSGAATQTYIDFVSRGYSAEQALAASAAADLTEAITEWIGGEAVMNHIIRENYGLKAAIKQFMSEGLEELAGNWVNDAVQAWALKDPEAQERIWDRVQVLTLGYVRGGENPEKALLQALQDTIVADAGDFVAGGLAALGDTVGSRVVRAGNRAVSDYSTGRQMIREGYRNAANVRTINESLAAQPGTSSARRVSEQSGAYAFGRAVRQSTQARTQTNAVRAVDDLTPALEELLAQQSDRNADRQTLADRKTISRAVAKQLVTSMIPSDIMNERMAQALELSEAEEKVVQSKTAQSLMMQARQNGLLNFSVAATLSNDQVQDQLLDRKEASQIREGQSAKDFMTDKRVVVAAAQRYGSDLKDVGIAAAKNDLERSSKSGGKRTLTDEQVEAIYNEVAKEAAKGEVSGSGELVLPRSASTRAVKELKTIYKAIDAADSKAQESFAIAGLAAYNAGLNYGGTEYAADLLKSWQEAHPDVSEQLQQAYDKGLAERQSRGETVTRTARAATEEDRRQRRTSLIGEDEARTRGVNTVDFDRIRRDKGDAYANRARQTVRMAQRMSRLLNVDIVLFDSYDSDWNLTAKAANGWYSGGTVYLDINAGLDNGGSVVFTLSHELTHMLAKRATQEFQALENFVVDYFYKNQGGQEGYNRALGAIIDSDRELTRIQDPDAKLAAAREELVARSCENLLTDSKAVRALYEKDASLAGRVAAIVRKFVDAFDRALKALVGDSRAYAGNNPYAEMFAESAEAMRELQRLWDAALMAAAERTDSRVSTGTQDTLAESGLVATQDGVVVGVNLAERMEKGGFEKPVDSLEKASLKTLPAWLDNYRAIGGGMDVAEILQTFSDRMMADDAILGYVPAGDYKYSKMGPLRKNVEYRWTFDMDASCPRTFQFVNYRDALQKIAGRPLTANESLNLMYLMKRMGQQIPCTYCYVENKRVLKSASYLNWFASRQAVLNAATDEEALPLMYGYNEKKGATGAAATEVFNGWREEARRGNAYNPSAEEAWTEWQTAQNSVFNFLDEQLAAKAFRFAANGKGNASTAGLARLAATRFGVKGKEALAELRGMVEQWQYDTLAGKPHNYGIPNDTGVARVNSDALKLHRLASNYASSVSQARLVDNFVPYTDQLKNVPKADKDYIMGMGGIRKHSSNDFRIDYVLDYFQFYADLAAGGWTGHTYTKSIDFARIFGRTGDRINISLAMETRNGKIVENLQEGASWREARQLREAYKDVGTMAMVTDNAQLSFALNSDWIDMIIPFHASGLPKEVWYNLRAWFDYTTRQLESYYTSAEMKQRLTDAGVDIKGLDAEQIAALFNETFSIKVITSKNGTRVKPHFFPNDTVINGQTVPGHHNDAARYMELCEQYGVHPRFYGVKVTDSNGKVIDVTEHPNYLKLIKETSRTDTEQQKIRFSFNEKDANLGMTPLEYAMRRMQEEAKNGGYTNTAEDPYGIVDMFRQLYLGKNRDIGWMPARDSGEEGGIEDRFHAALDATQAAYGEMYDADLQTLDTEGYQRALVEGGSDVFEGTKNSLKGNPNAVVGININDSTQAFTDEILRGEKTVETREAGPNALHGSLHKYVGQRVGIVRTGKGKAMLVGWATVAREIEYANEAEFRADYDRHRIAEGSSYDWHDGKKKFGYVLEDVTEETEPYEITERGIVARDVDRAAQGGVKYSLKHIVGQKKDYGTGVLLDTTLFNGISPRKWDRVLSAYVYTNLADVELTMYDKNGNPETVRTARANDRVKKEGAKNPHKVLDELARNNGNNIKALATVHLSEALLASDPNEGTSEEHKHQWLDQNGWRFRKVYLEDRNGTIYESTINIASGRDREIVYTFSNTRAIDKSIDTARANVPSAVSGGAKRTNSSANKQTLPHTPHSVKARDADGRELSAGQAAFFRNSKVRDENGNLKVMYHGTNSIGFTVFDPYESDDHISLFFTDNPRMADTYTRLQSEGYDVDPYNMITGDSSAAEFNAAAEKRGSPVRVIKITQDWLAKRRGQYNDAISDLKDISPDFFKQADILFSSENAKKHGLQLDLSVAKSSYKDEYRMDPTRSIRSLVFAIDQYFGAMTDAEKQAKKTLQGMKDRIYAILGRLERYGIAAEIPDSAVGKYVYEAENPNDSYEYEIGTNSRGFSGGAAYGSEANAVRSALERSSMIPQWTLGNRYKVYLNLTNPYIMDAGTHINETRNVRIDFDFDDKIDVMILDEYGDREAVLSFDNSEEGIQELRKSIGDAATDEFLEQNRRKREEDTKTEEDKEFYSTFYGALLHPFGTYDIKDAKINHTTPGRWNDLEFNGEYGKKTRDVAKWAKENGYDGVIIKNVEDAGGYAGSDPGPGTIAIAFSPEQVKSTDNLNPTEHEDIRYSLKSVDPVQPSTDAWQRGHDEAWFIENGYPIYRDVTDEQAAANEETGQNKRGGKHGTQITSTQSTYQQVYDLIRAQHPNDWRKLRILDASSGIGLGTRIGRERGFNVTDIEPYPSADRYQFDKQRDDEATWVARHPDYTDYSRLEELVASGEVEGFDYIISNAVLNVIPQDTRDNLTVAMGHLLKPGGQMFVNVISRNYQGALDSSSEVQRNAKGVPVGAVRTAEGDYSQGGNVYGRGHETFVWKTNTVQKVFSYNELTAYLRDALGDGYTVEPFRSFGMTAAMVTKNADIRYSQKDRSDEEILEAASEEAAVTPREKKELTEYKAKLRELWAAQNRREEVLKETRRLLKSTEPDEVNRRHSLQREAARLKDQIAALRSDLLQRAHKEALRSVISRERDAAYKAAAERGRRRLQTYRIQRDQGEIVKRYRGQIEGSVKDLLQLVTENSDKRHVPDQLRQPLAEFLQSINLESRQAAEGGPETRRDSDWARRFERLQNALNAQRADEAEGKADANLYLPDDFYDLLNKAAESVRVLTERYGGGESIYASDAETLRDIAQVLKILQHVVKSANQTMVNRYAAKISELGTLTMDQLRDLGAAGTRSGIRGWLNNLIYWQNGTPYYVFKRFGEAGFSTFQAIMDGQGKLAAIAEKIIQDSRQMFTSDEVKAWQEEVQEVELSNDRRVRMTTAQLMSFYCLSKRQQAVGHLLGGGMKIDAFKDGRSTVDDRTDYVLGVEDIMHLNSLLTDRQREVADALQRYMSTYGSELGNEVTMRRFGYKAYGETNYFPIQSDKQNLNGTREEEQRASLLRLLNMSHTKSLVDNANNALVVSNIFDVFSNHMSDMAEYNALALPVLDMVRWFNYKNRQDTEKGQIVTDTVQKSLATAFGGVDKGGDTVHLLANEYVKTFLKDLNGNNERGRDIGIGSLMSRYKRASVAANLRVAIQQPMSIMRAGAVLDYKWIARGVADAAKAPRELAAEMSRYSNEAKWKDQGHHDIYIGRSVAQQIKNDQGVWDRAVERSMIMAELGDKVTWTALWAGAKAEQQAKGLDGEALLEATAQRFQEVIYATQVMDATTTRSQSMRSNSPMNQMWTAFMAEPTLSVNLLANSVMEYRLAARRGGDTAEARKKAFRATWKVGSRAVTAYIFNALAVTLAESLMDAFRDDDDYETFVDKYMQALGENWFDEINPLSKVTVLKDVLNIFTSKYGAGDRMDLAALTSAKKSVDILIETYKVNVLGEKATETTYYGKMTWYGKAYQLLKTVSQISGVPFSGLSRELQTVWNNLFYPGLKAAGVHDVQRLKTYSESAKNVGYPNLYDAIVSGDERAALRLRQEMYYNGVADEDVVKGLKEQIKEHYLSGDIDRDEAARLLVEYCGQEVLATGGSSLGALLDKWETGSDFTLGGRLEAAFDAEDEDAVKEAIRYSRTTYLQEDSAIKSTVTSYWKKRYEAGTRKDLIRSMMMATGLYSAEDVEKKFAEWDKAIAKAAAEQAEQDRAEAEARERLLGA